MKRSLTTMMRVSALMAILCLAVAAPAMASFIEDFTNTNASWNYGYGSDFLSPKLDATWLISGGNPDGCISGAVENLYAVWTYQTGPYGDMTGQTMTIDTMLMDAGSGNAEFYVGRSGTFFVDGSWSIAADTSWTTHTAILDDAHFTHWSGSNSDYTLAEVLQAPTDIGIFFGGNLASGTGVLYVDNFGTVPEPGTLVMLGMAGLGLLAYARRRRS